MANAAHTILSHNTHASVVCDATINKCMRTQTIVRFVCVENLNIKIQLNRIRTQFLYEL